MRKFECLKCGNCCKSRYLCIYYVELEKFEENKINANKKFDIIPFRFYIDKTNKIIIDVIYRSTSKPCPFLKNNLCKIENDKFIACKKFPIATWIDIGFFSKLGFNRFYFELDPHCTFLKTNQKFLSSLKNLKLETIFQKEIMANLEDHKIWTDLNAQIRKIKKEKKYDIIIDYKIRKKDPKGLTLILNKWMHKPAHEYIKDFLILN